MEAPVINRPPVGYLAYLVAVGGGVAALFFLLSPYAITWAVRAIFRTNEEIKYLLTSQIGFALLGLLVGVGLGNLAWNWFGNLRVRWEKMPSGGKVTLIVAIFLGFLASVPFMFFLTTLLSGNVPALAGAMLLILMGFTTLSSYVLQSITDILPWNQGERAGRKSGIKILDTNVIIDGRILDVVRTGFLEGPYYVPGFVLDELQYIADSPDPLRRQRGRRGLDVLRNLQSEATLDVRTQDKHAGNPKDEVDSRLVRLARVLGADIVTNDFNLNRVAALQSVRVLNINDLSLALRPNVLPTEKLTLSVIKEGNQPFQGVGYLDDGTMVVVEDGAPLIGRTVEVSVTQVIQTERGKMIFAQTQENDDSNHRKRRTY